LRLFAKGSYIVFLSLSISLFYAIIRYNLLSDVPWADLPVFVLNKAIALTMVFLFLIVQLELAPVTKLKNRLWLIILTFGILHASLSFVLLGPEYYGKFYALSRLNWIGSFSILFGAIAFSGMAFSGLMIMSRSINDSFSFEKITTYRLNIFTHLFISAHIFIMGFRGWLAPQKWPGYLVPISLIGFVFSIFATVMFIKKDKA
jgi:hypothetical protein